MRAFPVKLPSGKRYWTVIDDRLQPVGPADRFLRDTRFGRDLAESTTKTYAGALVLLLGWCASTNRDWRRASEELGAFVIWLRHTPAGSERTPVRQGPGAAPARGERRINLVLTAVRRFLLSAVAAGDAERRVVEQLYEVEDARDLPQAARGEYRRIRVPPRCSPPTS